MQPRIWTTSSDGLIQYMSLTYNKLGEALGVIRKGFFVEESISIAAGLSKQPEAIRELDELIIDAFKDGVSTIAIETTTGKMAGCQVNKLQVKSYDSKNYFDKFKFVNPTTKAFMEINSELDKRINAFDLFRTDCYFECMFTGIFPQFRRKGIGKKFQEVALEIIENLRNGNNVKMSIDGKTLPIGPIPTAVLGIPTSSIMKKILEDIGYTQAMEINFGKYELQNTLVSPSMLCMLSPIPIMSKRF